MPPCGGHPLVFETAPKVASFKSCPRVGGIPYFFAKVSIPWRFKSCPRVGGILSKRLVWHLAQEFQVVPPCGGHPGPDGALPGVR